ncbi:MAG: phosphoadenylyl-sulfate reductase [Acidobacteria bacterium]|nr:MAG: phosphoadenylyl-sulfate reductase [Acidobacteriota bacterium]
MGNDEQRNAMNEQVVLIQALAESWSAEDALEWASEKFPHNGVALASSFGMEDMVLIDMASRLKQPIPVFTLDTNFLFPETYKLIETVEQRYGVVTEKLQPELTPDEQARLHGEALWTRQPDQCCHMRKIEPLQKKLSGLRAWVTGIRRKQSPSRAGTRKVEWDAKFKLVKVNPLAEWGTRQVWEYIQQHNVPYNPLHDKNYPSIGCTHCTRPIQPGQPERAGRWSGFTKTECGLHG